MEMLSKNDWDLLRRGIVAIISEPEDATNELQKSMMREKSDDNVPCESVKKPQEPEMKLWHVQVVSKVKETTQSDWRVVAASGVYDAKQEAVRQIKAFYMNLQVEIRHVCALLLDDVDGYRIKLEKIEG